MSGFSFLFKCKTPLWREKQCAQLKSDSPSLPCKERPPGTTFVATGGHLLGLPSCALLTRAPLLLCHSLLGGDSCLETARTTGTHGKGRPQRGWSRKTGGAQAVDDSTEPCTPVMPCLPPHQHEEPKSWGWTCHV